MRQSGKSHKDGRTIDKCQVPVSLWVHKSFYGVKVRYKGTRGMIMEAYGMIKEGCRKIPKGLERS